MTECTDQPEAVELQRKKRPVAVLVPNVVHFAAPAFDGDSSSLTSLPTNSLELLPEKQIVIEFSHFNLFFSSFKPCFCFTGVTPVLRLLLLKYKIIFNFFLVQ
jgi:hypothetical protein